MSDKKDKLEDLADPWDLPKKNWVGSLYEDYEPNGYSLDDEYGWTSQDKGEMYSEAIRALKAQIEAKRQQKKGDVGSKDI